MLSLSQVEKFVNEECLPADPVYEAQLGSGKDRWSYPPIMDDLKAKAKALGLWNMFLAKGHYKEGAGFTNLEYGLMCEQLGKSITASEATNNAAPDTGNMELLAKYGTEAQKKQWLEPLLRQEIRSCYVMTEPDTASSDATNVQLSIKRDGDSYVLNGQVCPLLLWSSSEVLAILYRG
jgi:acyl-CoA dehydrogenase